MEIASFLLSVTVIAAVFHRRLFWIFLIGIVVVVCHLVITFSWNI